MRTSKSYSSPCCSGLRLVWKFSIAVLLIIMGMAAILYYTADSSITRKLYSEHQDKGVAIVSNLAINVVDPILLDNIVRLQLLLMNVQESEKDVVYAFHVDSQGHVLSHSFTGGFPADLKNLNTLAENQQYGFQLIETEQGDVLDIATHVLHGDLGDVHIGLSRNNIEQKLSLFRQNFLLACILISVLAIMASYFLSRFITRPLEALAHGAEEIGLGNLEYRVAIESGDETGIVAKAFNQMAEALHDDIRTRVKIEHALRESEKLYRTLVENVDMGITLIDSDHNIVMANAAQGRLFNKDPGDFIEKKCFTEFEARDHVCPHCPGVIAMANGTPQEAIVNVQRADGSSFTVRIRAFPIAYEDGLKKGFIEVVEDITEQLKYEKNLAAEKEKLAVTLRSIGDGVITTDIAGKIVLVNKVAEELTGWSHTEAVGQQLEKVFTIFNGQTGEPCENPVKRVVSTGKIVSLDNHTKIVDKNGKERSIANSGAPIHDAENNIIGVVLVFRDITDQLRAERELLKIKKLESIGVLAGGIAHDFNNILTAILGNISLSLLDAELEEKTKKYLREAEKASMRASDLTRQLLTFSMGGEPVKKTASLAEIIQDSTRFVLSGLPVTCRHDIPDDLWLVEIDKGQIGQVAQNLVMNASQAMPEGGIIEVICKNISLPSGQDLIQLKTGKYVKITIKDNGIGMTDDIIENIFDPYFSTKRHGSGLGLAITHSIVSKHGGHVAVESVPGIGTTFSVYLPASEKQTISAPQKEADSARSSTRARILIMDDEIMVRTVIGKMLTELGHEVVMCQDGAEAVQLYKESMQSGISLDIVILDLTIPGGMGGKEAVQKILVLHPGAKVIVSSGYSDDPVLANYKKYGFAASVGKPYRMQELKKVIGELLF